MPRILVVDDDPLLRAVTADALRRAGYEVQTGTRTEDNSVAAAVVHVRGAASLEGFAAPPGTPLILLAEPGVDAADLAWRGGWRANGVLPRGATPTVLQRLLERLVPVGLPIIDSDDPTGEEYLKAANGPQERFPVVRLLYVAHRIEASGALVLEDVPTPVRIVLRSGRIVHVRGVPRLLAAVAPELHDHADLATDLAAAVAAGRSVDLLLRAAVAGLGQFCASLVGERGGRVRWDATVRPPPGSFALPEQTSHLLTAGLRAVRTDERIEALWGRLNWAQVHVTTPDDAPESRWGLDATSLRVLRVATTPQPLRLLIERAGGTDAARRREVTRAVDQLYILGFVRVTPDDGLLAATEQAAPVTVDPKQLADMQAALAAMEGKHPAEVLGLMKYTSLTAETVSAAFRDLSRRFHPDALHGVAPEIRVIAGACFQRMTEAYEALEAPGALAEAMRFIDARTKGTPYVTEADRQRAKAAFKRGETLYRSRAWREADPLLEEAATLDPTTWPYGLLAAQTGYLTRRLHAEDALKRLRIQNGGTPEREAEVIVAKAMVYKLEGRAEDALKLYRMAVQKFPGNRDAQREIRLYERRNPAPVAASQLFSGLLSRKPIEKPPAPEEDEDEGEV